jgi:hypothetical protein
MSMDNDLPQQAPSHHPQPDAAVDTKSQPSVFSEPIVENSPENLIEPRVLSNLRELLDMIKIEQSLDGNGM